MRPRDRLIVPLATAITLMWLAAGVTALYADDRSHVFEITSGIMAVVAGYVFGVSLARRVVPDDEQP